MIKLEDTLTVLERSNDGSVQSIMLIKKEGAEDYADYWKKEELLVNAQLDYIDKLLNNLQG